MKDFLKRHGEKVFLVVMALVCGWSLVGSVRSLGKPSVLPGEDQDAISRIQRQIQKGRPAPREIAPYQGWLGANFDAHGIGKATRAGGPIGERLMYLRPEEADQGGTPVTRTVGGSLGRPGKPAVEASRARITVTWSAPKANHVRVVRYEIFSRKGEGERSEKPVGSEPGGGGGPFSFTHSNLAPETTYSYWIRAVAKPAPPDGRTRVKPPQEGITIDKATGHWLTGLVGPVSGTTLSNVDFECSKVYSQLDKQLAKIVIKVWTTEKDKTGWKRYETDPGVGIGEGIVGKEVLIRKILGPGVKRKKFDSGYTLKAIKREVIKVPIIVWRITATGERKQVTIDVDKMVHYVLIENKEKGRVVRVDVGKTGDEETARLVTDGKAAPSAPSDKPKPKPESKPKPKLEPKDDDPLSKAKREMEDASARRPPPEAPPGTAPAEKPRAPEVPEAPEGFKIVKSPQSAAKVLVPKSWAAGLELDHVIKGRLLMWDVSADSVAIWGGSVPGSGMVLSDKAMPDTELAALIDRPTEGLSAEKVVGLVCDALKKKSLKGLAGAAARGENWSVSTKAGTPAAAFAMKVADQAGPLMVARYFALAPGRLYTVSFVCKAGDYEAQKGIFGKIVGTLDW